MFTVVIKGTIQEAIIAANRHMIILHDPIQHPLFPETLAFVDDDAPLYADAVIHELERWYREESEPWLELPVGTLLFYTAGLKNFAPCEAEILAEIGAVPVPMPVADVTDTSNANGDWSCGLTR